MGCRKVVVLSPPFYSHFHPLLRLAGAFGREGAQVTVACTPAFEQQTLEAGLQFRELELSRNSNSGIATRTVQSEGEAQRLKAFFDATRKGPVATLALQARERQRDMLADSERVLDEVRRIHIEEDPDLFVVDQLSYAATLALYILQLPFVTFCPGHPTYVPQGDQLFGVPYAWPAGMRPDEAELEALRLLSLAVEQRFTAVFNRMIGSFSPTPAPVSNAFRLTSPLAVIFNYPDFGHLHSGGTAGAQKIFMGHAFEPDTLDPEWSALLSKTEPDAPVVLVSFGTFLSERADILESSIRSVLQANPASTILVSAGSSVHALAHLRSERVLIEPFLPQRALLPHTDLVIFHGGCNTFTETLFYGKPMVILPFSSDQFAIARDAQTYGLADVLSPNNFTETEMVRIIRKRLAPENQQPLRYWQHHLRQLGPEYAVHLLNGSRPTVRLL